MRTCYKQYELQKAINDAVLEVYSKDPSVFEGDEEKAIVAVEEVLATTAIETFLTEPKVYFNKATNQTDVITKKVKNVLGLLYSEKKVNVKSPLCRMIDYTILPKKPINHNPDKNKFVEAISHLYWNTDAYSVGTTLTALRRFCENIHFNLGTPGAKKQDTCLYQYSAVQGGTGKSVLSKHWVNTFKNLGYQAGSVTINERWIGSEFSKYIISYQDEFFPPTKSNREGILTKLNPIICNDYYQVECKFQDAYQVKSQTSMILNSNFLPFDANTSRYWVIPFYNIDFRKDQNKSRIRTQEEDYEKWMLQALETVPFGECWENPIKSTKASVDEVVWKARDVLADIVSSSSFTATSATIREFVNAYIKATGSNVLPKALQNEVYQAIIEGDIEPVVRVNGNLKYSKYNWEEIADMETSETSKSNASLDGVNDPLDRTEVAFKMYLDPTDDDPTDDDDDDEPTVEETPEVEESEVAEPETEEPEAKELLPLHTPEYPEGFDMNQKVFTTEDAHHFGVCVLNDKFDKEMHNNVSGKEEFICASTYKENGLELTEGKLYRKTAAMLPVFFVYESDDLPLQEQGAKIADILNHSPYKKNIFSVTYSGSKSLHTLVYIDPKDRENVARDFKFYWSQVGLKIFGSDYHKHLDKACASIVRLTRMPGGYRKDKDKVQLCNFLNRAVEGVDVSYINELYEAKVEEERKQKEEEEKKRLEQIEAYKANGVTFSNFSNPDSEEHLRRAVKKSNNPAGQIAVELLDGGDPGSGANYIGAIGYAEKVCGKETAAIIRSLAHALHPSNIK